MWDVGGGEKVQEALCTSMPKYVLWTCDWMYIMPIIDILNNYYAIHGRGATRAFTRNSHEKCY